MAPSYQDVNIIWAGSDDGLIHITRDGGKHWENITPKDMPKNTRVSIIEASHFQAGTAYVAAKRYQMDDRTPYIWKTNDFGKTWTKIITGIRSDDYVHSIREDITRAGLLYAGTEHGIWVSYNAGSSWESLRLNLPDVQVSDIQVTDKDLVIGTHGRSIYILDDISPVRSKDAGIKAGLHLFKPYYAVRSAQKAVFHYYLDSTKKDLKIEILDAQGKLVNTFIGELPKTKKENGEGEEDDEDRKPKPPTIKTGLNVFEWDLKYPSASYFKGMIFWGAPVYTGPAALPGNYQVRITSGDQVVSENFEIKMDPRVKDITMADMQEKFNLAIQIRDQVTVANDAVIKIRSIKEKLNEQAKASKKVLSKSSISLIAAISKIEENLYQVRNQSSQDPLNFPIKLNNKMASLMRVVE